ncbi:type 1 glutamine amidotransferase domain-containing protein [Sphingobium yanoikuyae]|uniref:type 1 glutamine amidotransferase domain-containing protein n=1 Tax=Sphingobium yanoikuyae TaxID=13690 RepID=UPI0022DE67E1|nr:type 1 glutamine amidotransferase domain-containing protein [Sphingobium yanoikuyae]WBQ19304.1 type 1 glutamine amidotransferase [Sphingobium yanoikuyae]
MTLEGKSIAILIAPKGTEEREFVQPRDAVVAAGGQITIISLEAGAAQTNNSDLDPGNTYAVDKQVANVSAEEFDGLIIPGGTVGADKLRASQEVVALVRNFATQKKPIAAICHGPWLLVEAGALEERTVTSFPTLRTDIENAGGNWVDQEVVVDEGIITSRNPKDLPAFCERLVEVFSQKAEKAI